MKKVCPSAIHRLSNSLSVQPRIQDFKKPVTQIRNAYRQFSFVKHAQTIGSDALDTSNKHNYNLCLLYIKKALLTKYSPKYLERAPNQMITELYFSQFRHQIRKNIFGNKSFDNLLNQVISVYSKQFSDKVLKMSKKSRNELLSRIHTNDPQWDFDILFLIREFKKFIKLKSGLERVVKANRVNQPTILNVLKQWPLLDKFIEDLILQIIKAISFHIIGYNNGFLNKISELEFCQKGSDEIKNIINKKNTLSRYTKFNYFFAKSSFFPFLSCIGKVFLKLYPKTEMTKIKRLFLSELSKTIVSEKAKGINTGYFFDRFYFNQFIVEFSKHLSVSLFEEIHKRTLSIFSHNHLKPTFLDNFSKNFISQLGKLANCRMIPSLTKDQFTILLVLFFNKLAHVETRMCVNFLLGGIDMRQKICRMGKVTLYDPRIWAFGEDLLLDDDFGRNIGNPDPLRTEYDPPYKIIGKHSKKRNSARAIVCVDAYDLYSGIQKAEAELWRSVNTLVYASTASGRPGFKPQIPINYVLMDVKRLSLSNRIGPLRQEFDMLEINSEYKKITSFYNKLLRAKKTKLTHKIERAPDWYHRGYWSELPHQRFVSFWIALEHLFPKDKDKDKDEILLNLISKLTVTWKDDLLAYGLRKCFSKISKHFKSDTRIIQFLNSNACFNGWKSNYYIVFQHLHVLYPQLHGKEKQCADLIFQELSNENLTAMRIRVKSKRSQIKFKIAFMYLKRNLLVHEALVYSPELEIMTTELRKLFVDVLDSILLRYKKNSLSKITFEHNIPYQITNRGY